MWWIASAPGRGPCHSRIASSARTVGLDSLAYAESTGTAIMTPQTANAPAAGTTASALMAASPRTARNATGGTIGKIYVEDGDEVQQGALLIKLDETIVRANLQIIVKQLDELAVRRMRLRAEQEGAEMLTVPDALASRSGEAEVAALLNAERKLFESRRDARQGQQAQLRERIVQLRQEADGLAAQGVMPLYQRCVHLGCRVPFCQSSQWFECPCHGSKYNEAGEYQLGPAPRGMDRFKIEVDGSGNVLVDTSVVVLGPPRGTDTINEPPQGAFCVASG